MRVTACIECGEPTTNGTRCIRCNHGRRSLVRNPVYDTPEWRRLRARTLAAHRAKYGEWCPGYGVPAHRVVPPNRLSVDHPVAMASGGPAIPTVVRVYCVSCNSRKGAR